MVPSSLFFLISHFGGSFLFCFHRDVLHFIFQALLGGFILWLLYFKCSRTLFVCSLNFVTYSYGYILPDVSGGIIDSYMDVYFSLCSVCFL